jgi:hypothetical protein
MKKGKMAIMIVLAFLILGAAAGVKAADQATIMTSFQDAVNKIMYPQETAITNLSSRQIREYIKPNMAVIVANTIKAIYDKTKEDIGTEDVLSVLPPNIENVFRKDKDLSYNVREILENRD